MNTEHGSKPIRNEITGDNSNNYHWNNIIEVQEHLNRIFTAAKCETVDEVVLKLENLTVDEQTVWYSLKWLKQNHYLAQTESKLQEITKKLTEFLNSPL